VVLDCLFSAVFLCWSLFRHELAAGLMTAYRWISDRDQAEQFIAAFGRWAPLAFMMLQVLQVVLAPVPGEATGFIGGYIFGTARGFIYSSLALAVGSWINFAIGRYVGHRYVRRWIPADTTGAFRSFVEAAGHHRFAHPFYLSRLSQRLPVPVSGNHSNSHQGIFADCLGWQDARHLHAQPTGRIPLSKKLHRICRGFRGDAPGGSAEHQVSGNDLPVDGKTE
jgi:hypothetical protein